MSNVTNISGTNVAAPIAPFTSADNYPTHYAQYGKGGFRTVDTYGDLNEIPEPRLEEGMLVYVIEDKHAYQWIEGTWVKSKVGGGIEKVESLNDIPSDYNEEGNIIYAENPGAYYYYNGEDWVLWGEQQIYVGPTEPIDTRALWIDTANHHYDQNSEIIYSIQNAVKALQEQVNILLRMRTDGVISGDIDEGTRTELINRADPEKPYASYQAEANAFLSFLSEDEEGNIYLETELFREALEVISSANDILNYFNQLNSYIYLKKQEVGGLEVAQRIFSSIKGIHEGPEEDQITGLLEDEGLANYIDQFAPGFCRTVLSCSVDTEELLWPALELAEHYTDLAWDPNTEEIEPDKVPNATVKHISIKMGTWDQLQENKRNFIPGEIMWCTNRGKLYIYVNGSLTAISGSGGTNDDDDDNMDELQVNNLISTALNNVESIGFIPINATFKTDEDGNEVPSVRYIAKVNEEGKLIVYNEKLDGEYSTPEGYFYQSDEPSRTGLVINSFYLGGTENNEHSYQPCSHNFVELSNVLRNKSTGKVKDINLNGLYLLYKGRTGGWQILKLWGVVPGGGTFLIRGAQCSVMDVNTTKIKVKTYDMEWKDSNGNPIKFDQKQATFYLCWGGKNADGDEPRFFELDSSSTTPTLEFPSTESNNIVYIDSDGGRCAKGYIDLVGIDYAHEEGDTTPSNAYFEKKAYILSSGVEFAPGMSNSGDASKVLFRRWYPIDPVSQSNPKDGISGHNNVKYLSALFLSGANKDSEMPIEEYTPRASFEGKTIATTRTLFSENHPSTLTCTFGCQATDNRPETSWSNSTTYSKDAVVSHNSSNWVSLQNGNQGHTPPTDSDENTYWRSLGTTGSGATRCFCWNSVGYYDEYITYRKIKDGSGNTINNPSWIDVESIKEDTTYSVSGQQSSLYDDINIGIDGRVLKKYYSRVRWESAYGQAITTHRVIIRGLEAGKYEYKVTRSNDSSYESDIREFEVKSDKNVQSFNFIQTTDQQGANWEEYEVWNLSARIIAQRHPENTYDFTINTGDICYNGSRSNEWIDYYTGYLPLKNKVEMFTVGNNDLAPISMRDIGVGSESPWKINTYVTDYFYTFEIDPLNPQIFVGKSSTVIKDNEGRNVYSQSNDYKMPSLYSFNYGKFHFISLLSENRTISTAAKTDEETGDVVINNDVVSEKGMKNGSTVDKMYGVYDEVRNPSAIHSSKIFDTEEEWIIRDLIKWKNKGQLPNKGSGYWTEQTIPFDQSNPTNEIDLGWAHRQEERYNESIVGACRNCIVFTHEMPFNIVSDGAYKNYLNNIQVPRETAKAYLNRYHNYEFQRLFKLWGVSMVIGGHKHTCAITRPVYDAPTGYNPISTVNGYSNGQEQGILFDSLGYLSPAESFNPFMQVTPDELSSLWPKISDYCREVYNHTQNSITLSGVASGQPISSGGMGTTTVDKPRLRLEVVDKITTPYYVMCQATGFKNKSNSDLAAGDPSASGNGKTYFGPIPWELFYEPGNDIKGQSYPFYTVYELDHEKIVAKMYRIKGMYEKPKASGTGAGYWDLTKLYHEGSTLEENRNRIVNKIIQGTNNNNSENCVELYNKSSDGTIQGTTIIL